MTIADKLRCRSIAGAPPNVRSDRPPGWTRDYGPPIQEKLARRSPDQRTDHFNNVIRVTGTGCPSPQDGLSAGRGPVPDQRPHPGSRACSLNG